jgi:hypothetical protein
VHLDHVDHRRERVIRRGLVALMAVIVLLMALLVYSAGALGKESSVAWGARVVDPGAFSALTAGSGNLYAVKEALTGPLERGTRVVRIDPQSGEVEATSRVLRGMENPVFVDGALWLIGVASYSRNARHVGPPVLEELNPGTLHRERIIALAGLADPDLVGGPGGILWLGWSDGGSCMLRRISPATGTVIAGDLAHVSSGPCAGMAVDTAGDSLYVVSGSGGPPNFVLSRLNSRSGAVISTTSVPDISVDMVVAATEDEVWISGGDPGANGSLLYYSTSPLRLVSASLNEGGTAGTEIGGATGPPLPTFGQFPIVDISGDVVWVGSDGQLACLDVAHGTTLASVEQRHAPVVTGAFTTVGAETWALAEFSAPGPGAGLVRVSPPRACAS